jgi:hypothetical protein
MSWRRFFHRDEADSEQREERNFTWTSPRKSTSNAEWTLAAGVLVAAAAMTASYIPTRRAACVDPMETLRSE